MATRAIRPKRDDTILTGWQSMPEKAPSLIVEDKPTVPRFLAMMGMVLTLVGLLGMLTPLWGWTYPVSPGWGAFFLSIGLVLILYHAFVEKDQQFRLVYMGLGIILAVCGLLLRALPFGDVVGGWFVPYGIYALALALLLLTAVLRNETNAQLKMTVVRILGAIGAVLIVASLVIGQFNADFLAVEGVLLLILGLFYVGAFIGMQEPASETGFRAGRALGIVGAISFLITLCRILVPMLAGTEQSSNTFLVPSGLILLAASLVYMGVALIVCSDWPLVVLVKREFSAFFYSPIAYLVLLAMMGVSWINFYVFIRQLERNRAIMEPIVQPYIAGIFTVFAQIFVVPVLTMRLLSEEKRSGTLEMLLTAPVRDTTVLLSKFLAAWLFYLLTWLPTFLFLVALRTMAGEEFDYRPVFSFFLALMCAGAGFIAMGLFFSSITRNQIIAAVITFAGMTLLLLMLFLYHFLEGTIPGEIFHTASFYDLWLSSLEGIVSPQYLVFHISLAVFFLFLTDKVLEARKWS
jgi:ABC-2 type transport system permease protein